MLIDINSLPEDYSLVGCIEYIFEYQTLYLLVSDKDVVFLVKAPCRVPAQADEPDGSSVFQTEFPRAAAKWTVDSIENQLWRSEKEGGLPSGINHVEREIAGENLKIRRSMNAGGPGEKGFLLINFSRPDLKFQSVGYQEFQISDALLKSRVLDLLRNL